MDVFAVDAGYIGTGLGAMAGVSTIGVASRRWVVLHPLKTVIASKKTKAIFIEEEFFSCPQTGKRKKSPAFARGPSRWRASYLHGTFADRTMPLPFRNSARRFSTCLFLLFLATFPPAAHAHPGQSKGVAVATPTPPPQTFAGIGAAIFMKDGKCVVVDFVSGSGALAAGLQVSDVITHVDRRDISGLDISDIVPLLRGPSGSTVTLTIDRKGTSMSFTVTRRLLKAE